MEDSNKRVAIIALMGLRGVGPVIVRRIEDAIEGDWTRLESGRLWVPGIPGPVQESLQEGLSFDWARQELVTLRNLGGEFVLREEAEFPEALRGLSDCPAGLYRLGKPRGSWGYKSVSVVGTRGASNYGREVTRGLVQGLCSVGLGVISGLAEGIDTEAHRAALAGNGQTAAFIGSGLQRIYPACNQGLAREVSESLGVWSEFPLKRQADRQSFPQRNRLVAGATSGVLVVESGEAGGSLITARFAAQQGRHVWVIPGRIDSPTSRGCHELIRSGATLVGRVEEILEDLQAFPGELFKAVTHPDAVKARSTAMVQQMGEDCRLVWSLLEDGPGQFPDQLAAKLGWSFPKLSGVLVEMEINGWLNHRYDGSYEAN